MINENPVPAFAEFFGPAALSWLSVVGLSALLALVISVILSTAWHGPDQALMRPLLWLREAFLDFLRMSPRRVFALARLAVQESMRRRIWAVFVVFLVILGGCAWYLKTRGQEPARLYMVVVFGFMQLFILLQAVLVTVFSLPADIGRKTIHTVVTKPVRTPEIVLGRLLGFTFMGTVLLVLMAVSSYLFVVRALTHTHTLTASDLSAVVESQGATGELRGQTTENLLHRHNVIVRPDGTGSTNVEQGHWHSVTSVTEGGETRYVLSTPRDMFLARVPVYGQLRFLDRAGAEAQGINVGDVWEYRKFIEGGTAAAAIWRFEGVTQERFPEGLEFHSTFEIFRSYKGEIEEGIAAELVLRNPDSGLEHVAAIFTPREHVVHVQHVGVEFVNPASTRRESVSLFEDLAPNGRLEVQIRCVPPSQYIGMNQADLYMLASQESFELNFIKGCVSLWLQMVVVIAFGVTFSTFLNAPVGLFTLLALVLFGLKRKSVDALATGGQIGGGPLESTVRLYTHQDMLTPMPEGWLTTMVKSLDQFFFSLMKGVGNVVPNLPMMDSANYVASGYDVPLNHLAVNGVSTLAYVVPLVIVGYFCLKSRELAK